MKLRRILLIGTVAGVALVIGGCGSAQSEAECEELYAETIRQVQGVESVEPTCDLQFGSGGTYATVRLEALSAGEADKIVDAVEEAMAREPRIDADWFSPDDYYLKDGTEYPVDNEPVRDLREELGVDS